MHHLFLAFQKLIIHLLTFIDLDVVMPLYNLLEYNKNYSKTTESFWNYYRYEPNSAANNNINYSIKDWNVLITKQVLGEKGISTEKESEIVVPLKYLSTFWRILDIPLINNEINLILTWS